MKTEKINKERPDREDGWKEKLKDSSPQYRRERPRGE
jgi:hypothetical protein